MSLVKDIVNMSDDDLREKVVKYMVAHEMGPYAFAAHCGLSSGRSISDFIDKGKILFKSKVKIIRGLKK